MTRRCGCGTSGNEERNPNLAPSGPPHRVEFVSRCSALRGEWPWRLPARAPTDPDERALTHPVLQPTAWPSRKGLRGHPSTFRGQAAGPRCAPPVSRARVCRPALRFPPQGPPGRVPLLRRYYQSATTSCRPSRRASLPSLGRTSASTRSFRSPAAHSSAGAWSWSPGSSGREYCRGEDRISKFPGNPDCPFAMFSRCRQDRCHQTATAHRRGPWYVNSRGSHERSFGAQ
jgi:hypothetical protein